MLTYTISKEERNIIEAYFFEKNAKDALLTLLATNKDVSTDSEIFNRVYNDAIEANVRFSCCFNAIVDKYVPKNIKYIDAKIEFLPCELIIEEV